jgi:hypothetical protein
VVAVGHDAQASVGQLPVERHGVVGGHEDVTVTNHEQRGHRHASQLLWRDERLRADVGGDGRQKPAPRPLALDSTVPALEGGRPGRIAAVDALRLSGAGDVERGCRWTSMPRRAASESLGVAFVPDVTILK